MSEPEVRARLRVVHISTWPLIRTGFLVSVSIAITMVSSILLGYVVLTGLGVFDSLDQVLGDLTGTKGALTDTFTLPVVIAGTLVTAAFEVVVTTMMFAVGGFIYNLTVPFTRGLELTMAEDKLGFETEDLPE